MTDSNPILQVVYIYTIISSVLQVSSTRETFQDLSLPIPGKDHLHVLHASQGGVVPNQQAMHSAVTVAASAHKGTCGEVSLKQTWLGWMFGWMKR